MKIVLYCIVIMLALITGCEKSQQEIQKEQAKLKAEEQAKLKAEEQAKLKAEEQARVQAEESLKSDPVYAKLKEILNQPVDEFCSDGTVFKTDQFDPDFNKYVIKNIMKNLSKLSSEDFKKYKRRPFCACGILKKDDRFEYGAALNGQIKCAPNPMFEPYATDQIQYIGEKFCVFGKVSELDKKGDKYYLDIEYSCTMKKQDEVHTTKVIDMDKIRSFRELRPFGDPIDVGYNATIKDWFRYNSDPVSHGSDYNEFKEKYEFVEKWVRAEP